jgi:DNA-binding NtrC family response regulator
VRHPAVVVYEADGRLAGLLGPAAARGGWVVRESRQVDACLRQLDRAGPCVLVVKVGRDLDREFHLLERAAALYPDVRCVILGDLEHASLAGLAWDLGAAYVLFPPQSRDRLPEIVAALLRPEEPAGEPARPAPDRP